MSVPALARLSALMLLALSVPALAQQGPNIDVLTGEPVKPRREHPRSEPQIFNAPHAPRQEQRRADDPPIEIYAAPQFGGSGQLDPNAYSAGPGAYQPGRSPQADPYATRRPPPGFQRDRRVDDGFSR